MLSVDEDALAGAHGCKHHVAVKNDLPLLRVVRCAHGTARVLCRGEIHMLGGGGDSGLPVGGESAGLDADFSGGRSLGRHGQGLGDGLAGDDVLRQRLGRNGRRNAGAHQRNLRFSERHSGAFAHVIVELVPLNAGDKLAILPVKLDPDFVQQNTAVFELLSL